MSQETIVQPARPSLRNHAIALNALKACTIAVVIHGTACKHAAAEEQHGVASASTGRVTAQARVNLSVTVTRVIALGVGAGTLDMRSSADGLNTAPPGARANVFAWTNAIRGSVQCTVGDHSAVINQRKCAGYALGLAPAPTGTLGHQPVALIYTMAGI